MLSSAETVPITRTDMRETLVATLVATGLVSSLAWLTRPADGLATPDLSSSRSTLRVYDARDLIESQMAFRSRFIGLSNRPYTEEDACRLLEQQIGGYRRAIGGRYVVDNTDDHHPFVEECLEHLRICAAAEVAGLKQRGGAR